MLRWAKAGFYCRQALFRLLARERLWYILQTRNPLLVFVLYPVVVVLWLMIGFHGNAQPSRKQRQLIKAALTLFQPTQC